MDNLRRITEKLASGQLAFGSHVAFDSPFVTEMIAGAGYDFIWIDAEHGALDKKDIQLHLLACRAAGAAGLVRVPSHDPDFMKNVLDMGAEGVIVPMVNTAAQARAAAAATHYPPEGIRGMGLRRVCNYGLWDKESYLSNATSHYWTIAQIEHIDAMAELEEIVATPGIDAYVIGPNDFSTSMSTTQQRVLPSDAQAQLCFDTIAKTLRSAGKPFGVSGVCSEEFVRQWIGRGACLLSVNFDFHYIINGAKSALHLAQETALECGR